MKGKNFAILIAIILAFIALLANSAQAQKVVIQTKDGNYTTVKATKAKPINTGKKLVDGDKVYDIYITDKGKMFIMMQSKKTGKFYRSYLKQK